MFFLNTEREKYINFAKQIIEQVKQTGDNPNMLLDKLAKEQGLNDHQRQRIVEEFNVHMFLDKLKEGTQHEMYQLMEPIIDEPSSVIEIPYDVNLDPNYGKEMQKTASYNPVYDFGYEAYSLTPETINPSFGYYAIDDTDYESLEKKAFEIEQKHKELEEQQLVKEAMMQVDKDKYERLTRLVKIANESPALAKVIVHDLVKVAKAEEEASELLYLCKHSTFDVQNANIKAMMSWELEKLAEVKEIVEEIEQILPTEKELKKGGKKVVWIAKKIKEKPHYAIISAIIAKGLHDMVTNEKPDETAANIAAFSQE